MKVQAAPCPLRAEEKLAERGVLPSFGQCEAYREETRALVVSSMRLISNDGRPWPNTLL